jgi:hypothetical protein
LLDEKKNNKTYIHYITRVYDTSFISCITKYGPIELLGRWLVLVRTGPLCPHAHSKLIFVSSFPLVKAFMDAFTIFPTETVWLGRPSFNI